MNTEHHRYPMAFTWNVCAVLVLLTMLGGVIFVAQDRIWLAPPYLYDSARIKLAILFLWIPLVILLPLLGPEGNSRNFVRVVTTGAVCMIVFAYCSAFIFIAMRSIPSPVFCKSPDISEDSINFVCGVPHWENGWDTYYFNRPDNSIFMYLVRSEYKGAEN